MVETIGAEFDAVNAALDGITIDESVAKEFSFEDPPKSFDELIKNPSIFNIQTINKDRAFPTGSHLEQTINKDNKTITYTGANGKEYKLTAQNNGFYIYSDWDTHIIKDLSLTQAKLIIQDNENPDNIGLQLNAWKLISQGDDIIEKIEALWGKITVKDNSIKISRRINWEEHTKSFAYRAGDKAFMSQWKQLSNNNNNNNTINLNDEIKSIGKKIKKEFEDLMKDINTKENIIKTNAKLKKKWIYTKISTNPFWIIVKRKNKKGDKQKKIIKYDGNLNRFKYKDTTQSLNPILTKIEKEIWKDVKKPQQPKKPTGFAVSRLSSA